MKEDLKIQRNATTFFVPIYDNYTFVFVFDELYLLKYCLRWVSISMDKNKNKFP